jgi:hypothetical protein
VKIKWLQRKQQKKLLRKVHADVAANKYFGAFVPLSFFKKNILIKFN